MKKVESVLNGLLGCKKTRPLATFPQIFFGLLSLILPKKFTMKRGEDGAKHAKLPLNAALEPYSSTNLTIQK
jgi:hypothetical protein